ncbi:MAG: hypothetical protein JW793_08965 [Acidobacteria bacterium]|nr:hypothetical protein [Acidobacteriota bacterium]
MAIAAWPATLPQKPLAKAYDEQLQGDVMRFRSPGPVKLRRLVSIAPYRVSVGLWLTKAQTAIFDTFFNTTLQRIYRFSWTHYRTDASIECRIITGDGQGPTYSANNGDLYYLSFTMEILP